MRIVIEGRNLPGRRFAEHENVHVALRVRSDPEGPVPGDAPGERWEAADVGRVDGDVRGPGARVQPPAVNWTPDPSQTFR